MFGHIIHLAVAPRFQPCCKRRFGSGEIGVADADRPETQFTAPRFDVERERIQRRKMRSRQA